jgi:prolyl oligopeptidase
MNYPHTKRLELVEEHFGHTISDPYRWLEADARSDPKVAGWIEAQNRLARAHLDALPGREVLHRRLIGLFDHVRLTAPVQGGGRYFFTRNPGLEAQPALVMREGLGGSDRVLIDPNAWEQGGTTALAEWAPSHDGQRVAFAVQHGGTDWRTIRVLEVDSGATLDDAVEWARFTNIAWAGDGSGFFYSRYPQPAGNAGADARLAGHAVYLHVLGTPQQQDRLVHATPDQPHLVHVAGVTDDGRYVTIYSSPGSGGSAPTVVDLHSPGWSARTLVADFDHYWSVVGNFGTNFILTTQQHAERGKLVTIDLGDAQPIFIDLVPEKDAVLNDSALVGGRLIVSYLVDAKTQVERYRLDGTPDGEIELPGIGSAGGFRGRAIDNEAFFAFTSYDAPTAIYRHDVASHASTVWVQPKVTADLDRIVVEQRFYASKDGTRVPMFVIRRKDMRCPTATMLYVYGGYGISSVPFYSPAWLAWVEQGGVVAVANVRGGGEYGKRWHDAGRLLHKQNSFDDCIAAGE